MPWMPHEAREVAALAARARAAIGDAEWSSLEAAGRQLELADAVAQGSALANEVRWPATGASPGAATG
jgi:hypothetical protein